MPAWWTILRWGILRVFVARVLTHKDKDKDRDRDKDKDKYKKCEYVAGTCTEQLPECSLTVNWSPEVKSWMMLYECAGSRLSSFGHCYYYLQF